MGAGHDHGTGEVRHERPLWWALGLTAGFLIAEVVGALLTNSLALLSDAAHMGTDVLALAISLVAFRSRMETKLIARPIPAMTSMPVEATAGGSRNRPAASQRMYPATRNNSPPLITAPIASIRA